MSEPEIMPEPESEPAYDEDDEYDEDDVPDVDRSREIARMWQNDPTLTEIRLSCSPVVLNDVSLTSRQFALILPQRIGTSGSLGRQHYGDEARVSCRSTIYWYYCCKRMVLQSHQITPCRCFSTCNCLGDKFNADDTYVRFLWTVSVL
jgi:hypothetical protein